ncbi:PDZ domain-containing protein, partial [bacterium]|nr:PDZ domain-containing protein [bacterium]MBU1025798.1 PDZ domain-containing protein [bacterium]
YQGDLWSVDSKGGMANRLTYHDAYDARSRFSPDGSKIAFNSTRFGNWDIFVMPSDGSRQPERITQSSTHELLQFWFPDSNNLLITSPGPMWRYNLSTQDMNGGMSIPLFEDLHDHNYAVITKDGGTIYYLRACGWLNSWRTGYKGSADHDIWSYDTRTKEHKVIYEDNRNQQYLRLGHDGTYLIFADYVEQGSSNVARLDLNTKKLTYLTNFDDDTVRQPAIDDKGVIVFEYMNDLWRMEPGKKPSKLTIFASAEDKTNQQKMNILTGNVSDVSVSPDNSLVAVDVDGDIVAYRVDGEVDNEGINLTDTSDKWETEPIFSSDGKSVYYLKDSGNGNSLIRQNLLTMETDVLIKDDVIHYLQNVPTTDLLSFVRESGEIVVFDPEKKSTEQIGYHICYTCGYMFPMMWSPDGRYLAVADNLAWATEIYIIDRESKEEWNISNYYASDNNPGFSPDGKWFAYSTYKDNRAVVQMIELDPKADVKTTVLIAEEEKVPEESAKPAAEPGTEEPATVPATVPTEEEKKIEVKINFDRIDERTRIVSMSTGYNTPLGFTHDGEWLFYRHTEYTANYVPTKDELWKVPTDIKSKEVPLNLGPAVDALVYTADSIYAISKGMVFTFSAAGMGEPLPFAAKQNLNRDSQVQLAYLLVGQTLKESFYDKKMHGVDFEKLRKKYLPMIKDARTPEDIAAIMNRLNGELNASHLGAYGPSSFTGQPDDTATLGIEWDRVYSGPGLKVRRIHKDGPADKPDIEIAPGDIVLQIDGNLVDIHHDPSPWLNNKADTVIALTVKSESENREVKIRAESGSAYYEGNYKTWVEENRKLVDKLSGGRLGYVHIQQMVDSSLALFEKEYYNLTREKEGVVIDVRFNPGGRIHEELIDILDRRLFGYSTLRGWSDYLPQPYTYNRTPSILVVNQACTSDSEIFPWAYKTLGLGKLVGMETYGCVIGTTGKMLPGGYVMGLPCEGWFRDDFKNLENEGVKPDIEVPWPPDSYSKNSEPQLERAVEELLKEIG